MTKSVKRSSDPNLNSTSASEFVAYYNNNIPTGFPRATLNKLAEFRQSHPMLFKEDDKWIIDKHRKRFMDWMVSHQEK